MVTGPNVLGATDACLHYTVNVSAGNPIDEVATETIHSGGLPKPPELNYTVTMGVDTLFKSDGAFAETHMIAPAK